MDPTTRNQLQRATQDARRLMEAEFAAQLEGTYDILPDGRILPEPGAHLDDRQRLIRGEIIAAIEHIRCKEGGKTTAQAIDDYRREAAFTFLNRFAALKMLEARGLVQQCVSKGDQSSGFKEFTGLAPGLSDLPNKGYRLYLECLFDELGTEVNVLFDRRDPASLLWPRRQALLDLLDVLNRPELAGVWGEDEAIGWIYQYFNSDLDRRQARYDEKGKPKAPQNSYELAVRNQFFTPRYVVEFLTDNTLGRIWYEMRRGHTALANDCRFLVRRPNEVFLAEGEAAPAALEGTGGPSRAEQPGEPYYIPYRAAKDPRDLKILDPACGSGHFLLYGFDLLLTIYREAWEAETSPKSEQTGTSLREEYRALEDLRLEIPRLILRHNIHGIDIDPRCAQIAALALWMRAQRAFNDLGIGRDHRPTIRKTNIIVAEPMPGERDMLDGFLRSLREDRLESLMQKALEIPEGQRIRATKAMADSLCRLVQSVWDKMKLAGNTGSLLKIEEELASAIEKGRGEWEERLPLFRVTEYSIEGRGCETYYRRLPGADHDFWDKAETLAIRAIGEFAASARDGDRFRRNLFAEDATRGFAFVDLCRQRFDVVLMNPPFGEASVPSKPYVDETYGDTKGDLYTAFVECFETRLVPAGFLGILSSRTGFFQSQSEDWRKRVVLRLFRPTVIADLGLDVLEATVEVAAYVLRSLSTREARDLTLSLMHEVKKVALDRQNRFSLPKWQAARNGLKRHQAVAELQRLQAEGFIRRCPGEVVRYTPLMRAIETAESAEEPIFPTLTCIRALKDEDKEAALSAAILEPTTERVFRCNPNIFLCIPSGVFAYWAPSKLLECFRYGAFLGGNRLVVSTNPLNADFRYVRCWWEVEAYYLGRIWRAWAKGGSFSPFYYDIDTVIIWDESRLTYLGFLGTANRPLERPASAQHFFRPGLTWPRRTQSGLALRAMPAECIFADKGPAVFVEGDNEKELLAILSLVNSTIFRSLVDLQVAFGSFEVGVIQRTPVPPLNDADKKTLSSLARRAWSLKRSLDTRIETSHAFTLPALLQTESKALAERVVSWSNLVRAADAELAAIQAEIDERCFDLYDIGESDRRAVAESFGGIGQSTDVDDGDVDVEPDEHAGGADSAALAAEVVSWAVGVAFGRFDVRLATGARSVPPEPGPFDSLPTCSPGMLASDNGLPLTTPPPGYPISLPAQGILVDDSGHALDFAAAVRAVLDQVFGNEAEAHWQDAASLLAPRGQDLRYWFARDFFDFHLKRYTKSHRQSPIYWPLSSSRGGYTIWLYFHRFRRDTLVSAMTDFAKPRLQHERFKLGRLQAEAGPQPTRNERQMMEEQESLVSELEDFIEELSRVAPLWDPDQNDGVIINFAPLWRLIGHAGWRKSVRDCWDTLRSGSYDWSHLAMHLWPERVVPKCVEDASLAIAHGLGEVFWERDARDQWIKKAAPSGGWRPEIDRLVAERTSPAVKSALESLLGASAPGGKPRRGRREKSNA